MKKKHKKLGEDARGRTVRVGDRVLTKKGRIFEVMQTETSLRVRGILRARALAAVPPSSLKLARVFRVKRTAQKGTTRRWRRLWDVYVIPLRRKKRALLRRVAKMPKQLCPVCNEVWFKLGVPVWKGKKLRVCATPCKHTVRRGVAQHGAGDKEARRRAVAYKYMKRGGQLG